MNRMSLIAASALLILAIGGGIWVLGSGSSGPNPPTLPPAATPSTNPSFAGGVPAELRFAWLGDFRAVPGLSHDRSILEFSEDDVLYVGESLDSDVSIAGPGVIRLVATTTDAGCAVGDEGTYAYRISPGGTKLTLTATNEPCTGRGTAVAGDWVRSSCLNSENFCLGPLEAGEYPSYFIAPRIPDTADWAPQFGAIRYTVPEGWAATADWPREYFLEPADWYAENQGDIASETRGIYVGSHVVALTPSAGCAPHIDTRVDRSAAGLAAWLADHPSLDASEPIDITIGGVPGRYVDASLAEGAKEVCRETPTDVALLFGEADKTLDGRAWGALAGERSRYVLLDLDPGRPVLVMIEAREALFDDLLGEAMPIVESFRFE